MYDFMNRSSQEQLRKRLAAQKKQPDTLGDYAKAWFVLFWLGTIAVVAALLHRL